MSPFRAVPEAEWLAANEHAFAIPDGFPVTPGHTLVVTRRLIPTWFDASPAERLAILELVDQVKALLDASSPRPDGYNVGFNAGEAAGQTVPHLHVHVIPRRRGDTADPRGGVRHVIPGKGNYLLPQTPATPRRPSPLATGGPDDPFSRHLVPLFETASFIAIVAAFVQESGVERLRDPLSAALARGARIRLVTGDYLEITSAAALEVLFDLAGRPDTGGTLETRVVETARLVATRVFHPKAWCFDAPAAGVAFVGSSNLSRSALEAGIEWNLRVDRDRDPAAYASIQAAFERLWKQARPLDSAWLADYAARAQAVAAARSIPGEMAEEALEPAPEPTQVQRDALSALREAREKNVSRTLVVLATGLGKTWLAAFDYRERELDLGRRPRLLFVAERDELLEQAARTFRRLARTHGHPLRVTWCRGSSDDLSGEAVFATVAKLSRPEPLAALRAQSFDYAVIDEVHHAAAASYRLILGALQTSFLLGLTATPDRHDARDILGLFDDHVAFRAGIDRGIAEQRLVPFSYFGVKDDIDYVNIPWRNRRFDPDELARAAQTEARMETLWRAWSAHPGSRTLVFCCSIAHALYARDWLRARGVRAAAVYAQAGSDPRAESLDALRAGELEALCAVDLFNEGVDLPEVDRVVMLRPSESSLLFQQQLGRGLRACAGKRHLAVLDFVGNHKVFLERVRMLLSLGGERRADLQGFLGSEGPASLPEGCSVELELEAKQVLARLYAVGGASEVERAYRELRAEQEERPTAGQLLRAGFVPSKLRERHGSWFSFVASEGDLDEGERAAFEAAKDLLLEVETTEMTHSPDRAAEPFGSAATSCFKMITLEALLDAGALLSGLPVADLAQRSRDVLRRSPELASDVAEGERDWDAAAFAAYWRKNPIAAWTTDKPARRAWFRVAGDRFALDASFDRGIEPALTGMLRELVDYRLAQYRARRRSGLAADGFTCRVLWNQRDPILKLPSRKEGRLPEGETDVRLTDGRAWVFRFAKEYCNVARPAGKQVNELPDLLRRWFGPRAGQPGTAFDVRFLASPDGLWVEPVRTQVIVLPRRAVVAYPDLRAAAGHAAEQDPPEEASVYLPVDEADPDLFAVRVTGSSMDGGKAPLRDGDWALLRYARGASADALASRVILAEVPGQAGGARYQIKRLTRREDGWWLTSDAADGPSFAATNDVVPVATLVRGIHPEELGPPVGTVVSDVSEAFGVEVLSATSGRHAGHLFVFVERPGMLVEPDRVLAPEVTARPSETAFVLAKAEGEQWRFLGVGRPVDGGWAIPSADYATWREWGEGREVSRRLPEGALARAQSACDALLAEDGERWVGEGTARARVTGAAPRGGLRVGGGPGGFAERTVSLLDLGWVIVASDDVDAQGGVLDEERVNRLRYLEGTPRGSTHWIDTGWALAVWAKARGLVRDGEVGTLQRLRDGDRELDARFRVEGRGARVTVVVEARGGALGTAGAMNTEYNEGLRLLLARLRDAGMRLDDAELDTRQVAASAAAERKLVLGGLPYPVTLQDPEAVRRALSAAQSRTGRRPGAKGAGNPTRRIRLWVSGGALDARGLRAWLERGGQS